MFKLTLVSAPGGATPVRGASYIIQNGETSIGRQSGNGIVLQATNVSKRHCTLVVNNDQIEVKDEGSSNGTFINGVLARARAIRPGDRVSVGDFVFELSQTAENRLALAPGSFNRAGGSSSGLSNELAFGGSSNVIQFPGGMASGANQPLDASLSTESAGPQMPTDLVGKALWSFEHHVMPFFYQLLLKHEWRIMGVGLVTAFVLANLMLTVMPLTSSHRESMVKEVGRRAQFMAKQIVERNAPILAARAETKAELGSLEREEGVRVAVLTDLDNRIIAPGTKLNQYLAGGVEAAFAINAAKKFRQGRENGMVSELNDDTVVAVEPVKVLDPAQGRNVIVGMAVVSVDTTLSTPGMGEIGIVYSETLILTGLVGALLFLILYRLTLKPFLVLNDDIDKALKGEISQVTQEFKFQEMDPLMDIINSALKRVPRSDGSTGSDAASFTAGPSAEDFVGPLKMFGNAARIGLVICDEERRVIHMNSLFEEISGIRADNVIGSDLSSVARDQAFGTLTQDMFSRASAGGEGVSEEFEFSGISYRVNVVAFGSMGSEPRCYVLAAVKPDYT